MKAKKVEALYTRLMNSPESLDTLEQFEDAVNDVLPPGEPQGKKRKGEK